MPLEVAAGDSGGALSEVMDQVLHRGVCQPEQQLAGSFQVAEHLVQERSWREVGWLQVQGPPQTHHIIQGGLVDLHVLEDRARGALLALALFLVLVLARAAHSTARDALPLG